MRSPDRPLYSERLWPGPGLWLLSGSLVLALGLAYGAALGATAGWVVAGAGTLGLLMGIRWTSPVLAVDDEALWAGPARLPLEWTGRVLVLDAEQAALARGPHGDPTAHVVLRPGVGPGAVVVEVTDPVDPHRTWLLASRHPDEVASALEAAHGRLRP